MKKIYKVELKKSILVSAETREDAKIAAADFFNENKSNLSCHHHIHQKEKPFIEVYNNNGIISLRFNLMERIENNGK